MTTISTENLNLKHSQITLEKTFNTTRLFNFKYVRHHIFEFVYKILKHIFTSNKKLSNDYDNVISRLNKLEEENRQLKTCQIDYFHIKERENKEFKENLFDYVINFINKNKEYLDDFEERLDTLENENKYLKEKIYVLI